MNRVNLEYTHAPDHLQHIAFICDAHGPSAQPLRGYHDGLSFSV
jgi:hypothetical protein